MPQEVQDAVDGQQLELRLARVAGGGGLGRRARQRDRNIAEVIRHTGRSHLPGWKTQHIRGSIVPEKIAVQTLQHSIISEHDCQLDWLDHPHVPQLVAAAAVRTRLATAAPAPASS